MAVFHLLIILLCGAICAHAVKDVRRYFPRLLIFGGLGVIHGFVPVITPDALRSNLFSIESRDIAGTYAFFSVLVLAAGWFFADSFMHQRPPALDELVSVIKSPKGQILYRHLFWTTMIVGTGGWVIYFWGAGASLSSVMATTRFEYRNAGSTGLKLIGMHLVSLTFMPVFLGFLLPNRYRLIGLIYTIVLAVASFAFLAAGTRSIPLGMVGTIGMAYIIQKRVSRGRFLLVSVLTILILFLTVSLYEVRKVMSYLPAAAITRMMFDPQSYQYVLISDPLNYHEHLIGAIDSFPRKHPYLDGATYLRILFFFLPSSVAPDLKPEDTNILFAKAVYNSPPDLEVTIPPTIPGDVYINFWGWPGLCVLFFEGIVLAEVSRLMLSNCLWFTAFGPQFVRFAFLLPRGQPYDLFGMVGFVLVATWIMMRLGGYSSKAARRDLNSLMRRKNRIDIQGTMHEDLDLLPATHSPLPSSPV